MFWNKMQLKVEILARTRSLDLQTNRSTYRRLVEYNDFLKSLLEIYTFI